MPHAASRIEPRLDVDELDRQVSRAALPPRSADPDAFDRQFAGAKIAPPRIAVAPLPDLDPDTIPFSRAPLSHRAARSRPSMVPALTMLALVGGGAAALALYLG